MDDRQIAERDTDGHNHDYCPYIIWNISSKTSQFAIKIIRNVVIASPFLLSANYKNKKYIPLISVTFQFWLIVWPDVSQFVQSLAGFVGFSLDFAFDLHISSSNMSAVL